MATSIFARARAWYVKATVDEVIAMGMSSGAVAGLAYSCYDINNTRKVRNYYNNDLKDCMIQSVVYSGAGATIGAVFALTWPFAIPAAGVGAITHLLTSKKD